MVHFNVRKGIHLANHDERMIAVIYWRVIHKCSSYQINTWNNSSCMLTHIWWSASRALCLRSWISMLRVCLETIMLMRCSSCVITGFPGQIWMYSSCYYFCCFWEIYCMLIICSINLLIWLTCLFIGTYSWQKQKPNINSIHWLSWLYLKESWNYILVL